MKKLALLVTGVFLVLATALAPGVGATGSATPRLWRSCKNVHSRYPHGVGRYGAHDKTTGVPVRNFKHSNLLYATAMRWNKGLDRDKDKIACEQH